MHGHDGDDHHSAVSPCVHCPQGYSRLPHAAKMRLPEQPYNFVERVLPRNLLALTQVSGACPKGICKDAPSVPPGICSPVLEFVWGTPIAGMLLAGANLAAAELGLAGPALLQQRGRCDPGAACDLHLMHVLLRWND